MNTTLWARSIYPREGFIKVEILEGKRAIGIDCLALPSVDVAYLFPIQCLTWELGK